MPRLGLGLGLGSLIGRPSIGGGSVVPSFLPTDLPELELWLDAGEGVINDTGLDTPAANNETVEQWNNKVSGKPNLSQATEGSRPIFKSDVFGRKAVYFNGDALWNSGFDFFDEQYSYYLVATSLLGSTTENIHSAIRLGNSTSVIGWRGVFGAHQSDFNWAPNSIGVMNGDEYVGGSDLSRNVNNNSAIFSARFDLTGEGFYSVSRNLVFEGEYVVSPVPANSSIIVIGAGNNTGATRPINSNFSEVLVYRAHHDEATALQVINYLAQKWNIDTNL